jgi:hypothetical protein
MPKDIAAVLYLDKNDRFLKPASQLTPSMTEHKNGHVISTKGVQVIGNSDIKTVFSVESSTEFMGIAYNLDGMWYTTMGFCYVGTYAKWDDALTNLIVAYFG